MNRWKTLAVVCSAIGAVSPPALAWGKVGHHIVAEFAWKMLTPKTRDALQPLLAGDSLAKVSAWADDVRTTPFWNVTAPLHYLNVDPRHPEISILRASKTGDSVVGAVIYYREVLRSAAADEWSRTRALKLLVHFVGDIHQPLHVSHEVDRGGNEITVKFFGKSANLHAIWDTKLIEHESPAWEAVADRLYAEITDADRAAWSRFDPILWAQESYTYARTAAYVNPGGETIEDGDELDDAYFDKAWPIVELRLKQAAVRLAVLLNDIYDP